MDVFAARLRSALGLQGSQMPLDDILVVERCTTIAGAYAGRLLADLGATVVKMEGPDGDPNRAAEALFLYCNSRKLSLSLDPASTSPKLDRLLDEADVLVSDAPMAELTAIGLLDRAALIHVSVRPYGLTGPRGDLPGYDLDVFHSAGEGRLMPGGMSYEMFPERQPLIAGRHTTSYDAGTAAATAVCAALFARFETGRGALIEVSQQDVQLGLNRVTMDLQLNNDVHLDRASRGYDFGGIFPCQDGHITVRPNEDKQWAALATGMGRTDLIDDPRFGTRAARERNAKELNGIVKAYTTERTRDRIYADLSGAGAPVGTFDEPERIRHTPQFTARGWFRRAELNGRELTVPGSPFAMSETPIPPMAAAPGLGEHDELIGKLLDATAPR